MSAKCWFSGWARFLCVVVGSELKDGKRVEKVNNLSFFQVGLGSST